MSFMEDIKTDQRTQMLVAGMVVFALMFPAYFYYAAGQADSDFSVSGPLGTYELNGTYSYHEIGSGTAQDIADQSAAEIAANSDAGDVNDLNIVGFRVTTTHTDDEGGGGPQCTGVANEDDEITVAGGIGENSTLVSGTESPMETTHFFIPPDLLGATFDEVTPGDIEQLLNGGTIGFGEYSFEISVSVNKGQRPGCNKQDDGESVDWKIELISLDDYTIEMVEEEEEESE